MHLGEAESHRGPPRLEVVPGVSRGRRRPAGRVENPDVGVAILRGHQLREVQPRVFHDDRRRHHQPGDVRRIAGAEQGKGEREADGDAGNANTPVERAVGPHARVLYRTASIQARRESAAFPGRESRPPRPLPLASRLARKLLRPRRRDRPGEAPPSVAPQARGADATRSLTPEHGRDLDGRLVERGGLDRRQELQPCAGGHLEAEDLELGSVSAGRAIAPRGSGCATVRGGRPGSRRSARW